MRVRQKIVKGKAYYYFEAGLRIGGKTKNYSIYLGSSAPPKKMYNRYRAEIMNRIYNDLVRRANPLYLHKQEVINAEIARRDFAQIVNKLTKGQQEDMDEIDTVNFVYTTLSTEGVPVTIQDAGLAYNFSKKKMRVIRDENLQISLDMIKGLRYVRESKKGISFDFILSLHRIIMNQYQKNHPGELRNKQAYIYLKSYEKVEEIRFRPPEPAKLKQQLGELVEWYNSNFTVLNPIELAALLHLRFYRIHPFEDGNKRIARLLLNKAFHDAGYPLLNISKDTEGYFDSLIRSVEKNDEKPFVRFVLNQFMEKCRHRKKLRK